MKRELDLHFGALCHPISKQLHDQGLFAEPGFISSWQKSADAITRLTVQRILSDSEAHRARQRLIKDMAKSVTRPKV